MKNIVPIGMFTLLLFALYMIMKMNKLMTLQTTLIVGMAGKMGVRIPSGDKGDNTEDVSHTEVGKKSQSTEEEEEHAIVLEMERISNLIKEKKSISKQDVKYYNGYFENMHEDLQLANPSEIVVLTVTKNKLSEQEKIDFLINSFSDNIPKHITQLSILLSDKTGTKPNEGNTKTLLNTVLGKKIMSQEMKIKSRKRTVYGLSEWFDGKKMTQEFIKNIVQ